LPLAHLIADDYFIFQVKYSNNKRFSPPQFHIFVQFPFLRIYAGAHSESAILTVFTTVFSVSTTKRKLGTKTGLGFIKKSADHRAVVMPLVHTLLVPH
jgi:hypothetical protein